MVQFVSVLVIAALRISPFHLIWLLLVSYLSGYVALRSRLYGRIAWLYGHVIACAVPSNW